MMLKRSTTESKPNAKARLVRAGLASLALVTVAAAAATGCLDRPVVKAGPKSSNVFVDQIVQTAVDKIDLLFMVDNSVSMADKQEILKAAVPVLVGRLISPICVDAMGKPTGGSAVNGNCANGTPEFSPIGDIHVGIVSSSLGSHGSTVCDTQANPDDKARMIGSVRMGVASWNSQGFLAWDASGMANNPPGEKNPAAFQQAFSDQISAVGEHGCGFEASLESWYRFLVDPEPPANVTQVNQQTVRGSALMLDGNKKPVLDAQGHPVCTGCDDVLLAQRRAFLRPDSLVAIVMLSDENDCSIRDDGVGWFVGANSRMPRSTEICATDPNNACCRSCAARESGPPAGCGALGTDANCKNVMANQSFATWDAVHDSVNLRCYNQHQRFGFDLLYPTQRYVEALNSRTIRLQSNGAVEVANPLFDNAGSSKAPRDPSLVFLAGIVGVPWQDIADPASLTGPGLTYLTAAQLREPDAMMKTRWDYMLGSPYTRPVVPPADPFMRETPEARSGTNPIVNASISPADSRSPQANVINGHEQNIPSVAGGAIDDLQYACIFPLKMPKPCAKGDSACDCSPDKNTGSSDQVVGANSPLCQPPGGGAATATQSFAKAYPGARELQVLKDFGDNAIVASICPKVTNSANPSQDPNYGYNPAVGAIIERLKEALKGKCLPRPIGTDPDSGEVLCKVIEAQKENCNCGAPGRGEASAAILPAVRAQLKAKGNCGGPGQDSCDTWCQCEIKQEAGGDLAACLGNQQPGEAGYCYIDKNAELLAKCPANQQQLLRFVAGTTNPTPTPATGAIAFIACLGQAVNQEQ